MIKINNLSVGDWVRWEVYGKTYDIQITAISDTLIKGVHDGIEYGMKITQLSPIPIKAEILERNGFESTTKPNVFTLTHGKLQLYVSKELDGWAMSFVNFMERLYYLQVIRKSYIHELQHALRLAGVEKEITL